jgi:hypothetical protein
VCAGSKQGSGAWGGVAEKHAVVGATTAESADSWRGTIMTVRAHRTERAGERTGNRADEWSPRAEREGLRAWRKLAPTSRPHRAARGREGERARVGWR